MLYYIVYDEYGISCSGETEITEIKINIIGIYCR